MNDDYAPRPCSSRLRIGVFMAFVACVSWCAFNTLQLRQMRQESFAQEARVANRLSELRLSIQDQACRCVPEGDVGEDKMGAGGRIIPTVRSLADEAHQATIESRQILRKVDRLITDIESGAVGVELDGSIMRGHAEAKLKRN